MQFTAGFVALALAYFARLVVAKSCNRGGVYCGQSLLNRGEYLDDIKRVLTAQGQPTDNRHIIASIFDCLNNGEIKYRGFCEHGCGGVGSTDPDYCL